MTDKTEYKTEAQRFADMLLSESFSAMRARRRKLERLMSAKREKINEKDRDRKDHA